MLTSEQTLLAREKDRIVTGVVRRLCFSNVAVPILDTVLPVLNLRSIGSGLLMTAGDSSALATGRKLCHWSGLATKVQRKSGFIFGVEQKTIQLRSDAGFSQSGRCPQVLEIVPFVDVCAQKMNDRDMLGSDFPAGGSLGSRCTH